MPAVTPADLDPSALITHLGLADQVVDAATRERAVERFRQQGIVLPTFAELADPTRLDQGLTSGVDKDAADARNLFRVHWYNDLVGDRVAVPDHLVLPPALTGVTSPIIVVLGDRFPMITAHKVLAAYACLAPRVITGQLDPTRQRAIWPSTGNYARGGVAISRIMGCRGVAVLPAGMSQERFDWLDRWVADPADIIRTPGTESNVKEIYDACHELAADPDNVVLNQFSELGNHLAHYEVTGRALSHVFEHVEAARPGLRLAAFTSATGSAGTIAAGDRLKEDYGARIVAAEALECPTMLENGFGEHNIQGIGDKHIPLIHNVMSTDVVCAVSDRATDELDVLFNTDEGRAFLVHRKGVDPGLVAALDAPRPLVDLQRAGRHQDGPAPGPGAGRRRHHRGDGRRRALPERAGQDHRPAVRPVVRRARCSGGVRRARRQRRDRRHDRLHRAGSHPDLQPRLLHVGGAAGDPAGGVRGASLAGLLARAAAVPAGLGRPHHGVQRAGGRGSVTGLADGPSNVVGFRCAACGATVDVDTVAPWRCPSATAEDRHHVLHIVRRLAPLRPGAEADPFLAYGAELAWQAFALAHGLTEEAARALVGQVGERVAAVDGHRLHITPFARADALSRALGFSEGGGVWVKDETGNVAGSHKARHLLSILLHVKASEILGLGGREERLVVASCGNAALAAATLAAADRRELEVFVPPWASPAVVDSLHRLRAQVTVCPRRDDDPPGDPCVLRFREAVAAGAVPFSVQGPENALALDGGRTIGWEMAEVLGAGLDRVLVQVGGGALAACVAHAAADAGVHPRLHAVQAEGCAPLARAWARATELGGSPASRWDECMWPWEDEPRSVADGILDDETYDWLGVLEGLEASGGSVVVAPEAAIVEAHQLGVRATGIPASATGTAGLAGLLAIRGEVADDERVAVIFSGIER